LSFLSGRANADGLARKADWLPGPARAEAIGLVPSADAGIERDGRGQLATELANGIVVAAAGHERRDDEGQRENGSGKRHDTLLFYPGRAKSREYQRTGRM
jgi:hypothetical protein